MKNIRVRHLIGVFIVLVSISGFNVAYASLTARSVSTSLSLSTGTFRVAGTTLSTDANPLASYSPGALPKGGGALFFVHNYGTVDAAAFTLTISWTGKTILTLEYCGTSPFTFSAVATCTNGSTTATSFGASVPTAQVVTNTISISLPAGTARQFSISQVSKVSTTPSLSFTVSSSQIRAPMVTNS